MGRWATASGAGWPVSFADRIGSSGRDITNLSTLVSNGLQNPTEKLILHHMVKFIPSEMDRVFSALSRHTRKFRRVRVVLRQEDDRGTCETVACAVTVALEPTGSVRVRVTAPHVYAALNRAVERLVDALEARVEWRRSS